MSIEDVAAALRAALAKIAEGLTSVNVAAVHTYEARTLVEQATAGTSNPHAPHSVVLLAGVQDELVRLHGLAQAAAQAIEAYLANVASGAATTTTPAPPTTAPTSESRPPTPPTIPPERVEQLRRELPPDITPQVERPPGTPQPKTHGRWIGPDGVVHDAISGQDDNSQATVEFFKSRNMRTPTRATDVEMKLATYMRINQLKNVILAINHVPCRGPWSCDTLVPIILPEGYTLTVHGARGFLKVYRGDKES